MSGSQVPAAAALQSLPTATVLWATPGLHGLKGSCPARPHCGHNGAVDTVMVTHQVVLLYLCYCIYTLVRLKGRWVRQEGPSPGAPLGADTAGSRSLIPAPCLPPAAPPPDNCHRRGRGLRAGREVAPPETGLAPSPQLGCGQWAEVARSLRSAPGVVQPARPHPAGCKQKAEEGTVKQPHL